jgi:nucleotide-binding universal stress UspA family protein
MVLCQKAKGAHHRGYGEREIVKTILTAIEFSQATDEVMAFTRDVAKAFNCRVFLLHVEPPNPDFVGYEAGPQATRDAVAREISEDVAALHALADTLKLDNIEVEPLVIQGPTLEKLHEEAKALEADLLIIGAHTHGRFYTFLHGNLSEAIVKHPPCPVLVVPPKE